MNLNLPAMPATYEGMHRDNTEAATKRDDRASSHALVYGTHHIARHNAGYVR